jgi:hypothetical protein
MRQHDIKDPQELFASAARTTTSSMTFSSPCLGCLIVIDVTAITASPSVVFKLEGIDPANSKLWTILESAAIVGTGTTVLRVHPSLTASANAIAKDILPQAMKLTATHADTDSITYSVGFVGVS